MSPSPSPPPPCFPHLSFLLIRPPCSLRHQTLLICQGGLDEFRRFSERHSFGAALSLCQALVHIVLLTAGLALLPYSPSFSTVFLISLSFCLLLFCLLCCLLFLMVSPMWGVGEKKGVTCHGANVWGFHPLRMDTHDRLTYTSGTKHQGARGGRRKGVRSR